MMIYVPFIFFLLLFLVHYIHNKKKLDLICYIYAIYSFSGFCSIFIYDSYDHFGFNEINFIPAFLYCFLIWLCTYFVSQITGSSYLIKSYPYPTLFKYLAWISSLYFIFYFYMASGRVVEVLTGDIGELRGQLFTAKDEVTTWMTGLNPTLTLPLALLNFIFGTPWILQLMAFHCFIVEKMKLKYMLLLLLGSCLGVVISIEGVDRSGVAYWLMSLLGCYILFRPMMDHGQRKIFNKIGLFFLVLFASYLFIITIGRFGEKDSGDSLLSYFGQSYINFCYLFDNYECPFPTLTCVIPFTTYVIMGGYTIVPLQAYLTSLTGFDIGVFYTFLGHIYVTSNFYVVLLYCLFFIIMTIKFRKNKQLLSLFDIFIYFFLCSVLFLGVFTHYYAGAGKTFSIIFYGLLICKYKRIR